MKLATFTQPAAAASPSIGLIPGSPEQERIFEYFRTGTTHAIVNAVAGSGKSHTLVQGVLRLKDAGLRICVFAFNKHIADEMNGKFRAAGITYANACTYNSFGWRACIKAFHPELDELKTGRIVEEVVEDRYGVDNLPWNQRVEVFAGARKLVSLCKAYLLDGTDAARLEDLADKHNVQLNGATAMVLDLVPRVLRECGMQTSVMDYDDQVWQTVTKHLPVEQFDLLLIDELQDTSLVQQEMALMACPAGRIVGVGDISQCHPTGTEIYKTGTGYVPVESLKVGDELLSCNVRKGYFPGRYVQGRKVLEINKRAYDGRLIRLCSGSVTHEVTPEHRCMVRMNGKRGFAVYVMERGEQARVGCTASATNPASSVALRARQEHADRAWILRIFERREDATLLENAIAYGCGIPQLIFARKWEEKHGGRAQSWLDQFWRNFGKNRDALVSCLKDYGRSYDCPFWSLSKNGGEPGAKSASRYSFFVQACNLIDGWMRIAVDAGERGPTWVPVSTGSRSYKGAVYSLRVQNNEAGFPLYVAQGIVTHNSIFGFRGADAEAIPRITERLRNTNRGVETFPLTVTRRCPKSHVRLAEAVVPHIQALEDAPEGIVECLPAPTAVRDMHPGDLVLCRTNAPLVSVAFALIRANVKAVIRGRDVGTNLRQLVDKLRAGDSIHTLLGKLSEYREKELGKLTRLGERGASKVQSLTDRCDCVVALADGVNSVAALKQKIDRIFADFDAEGKPKDAVVLGSVHRTKGLEAHNVWVLAPELLPHPMAKQAWEQTQEHNLIYVAVTRAKYDTAKHLPGRLVFVQGAKSNGVPGIFGRERTHA